MEGEKKNIWYVIGALIIIALIGFAVLRPSDGFFEEEEGTGSAAEPSVVTDDPEFSAKQVLGEEALTQRQSGAIAANKVRILAAVRASRPLTSAERTEIGNVMLTQAHLYLFSEGEQAEIFAALSKPE